MYEKKFITAAIERSAETAVDRRKMLSIFGLAGAGAAAATVLGGGAANAATSDSGAPSAASVLNFALNLEYLEAEFYLRAAYGADHGLGSADVHGTGTYGTVSGGHKVPFKSKAIRKYAEEIAKDELEHVRFLRAGLKDAAVARPKINLSTAFTAAATAAGVIKKGQKFDPFANETNFLLGAFLFEDVGVTAYKGAAGFIKDTIYLDAAAGILAVEAYHAGIVRSALYQKAEAEESLFHTVQLLSNARDLLDGPGDDDQGIKHGSKANLVPVNKNGYVYSRTPGQVLNIVYLNTSGHAVTKGGFYPNGVNGDINTSIGATS